MQNKMIGKAIVSIALMFVSAHASAKQYIYTNHAQPTSEEPGSYSLRYDMDKLLQRHGHSGAKLNLCQESEQYFCFVSIGDHFAVPKKSILEVGDAWIHEDHKYVVERKQTISVWGRSEVVSIITSQFSEHRNDTFYYSAEHGLLALKYRQDEEDEASIFFLEGSDGFPF